MHSQHKFDLRNISENKGEMILKQYLDYSNPKISDWSSLWYLLWTFCLNISVLSCVYTQYHMLKLDNKADILYYHRICYELNCDVMLFKELVISSLSIMNSTFFDV